ncbi:MAG: transcription antitermination protein NusB [Saprospiraceae bacterium]
MVSRRNIRVKVMQVMYAMTRDQELHMDDAVRRFHAQVDQSFSLFLYNLLVFSRVTARSVKDADRRAARHLPTEEDKRFTPKIFENALMQSLNRNIQFNKEVDLRKLRGRLNEDSIRLMYSEFSKTESYSEYLLQEELTDEDHCQMLLDCYRFLSKNGHFIDLMEETFPNWIDDSSLVIGATKKVIKATPLSENFLDEHRPDADAEYAFGDTLLKRMIIEDERLLGLVEPILKNWDAERLAILDMILIKMALCEFLYFPSIPAKVTLNEYVEIAKVYSTDKSKEFINGIMDRLLKQLSDEGKIRKEGRGLLE